MQIKTITEPAVWVLAQCVFSDECWRSESPSLLVVYYSTPAQYRIMFLRSRPVRPSDPQSNIHISCVVCMKVWRYKVMYF